MRQLGGSLRRRSHTCSIRLEALEDRDLLAVMTVGPIFKPAAAHALVPASTKQDGADRAGPEAQPPEDEGNEAYPAGDRDEPSDRSVGKQATNPGNNTGDTVALPVTNRPDLAGRTHTQDYPPNDFASRIYFNYGVSEDAVSEAGKYADNPSDLAALVHAMKIAPADPVEFAEAAPFVAGPDPRATSAAASGSAIADPTARLVREASDAVVEPSAFQTLPDEFALVADLRTGASFVSSGLGTAGPQAAKLLVGSVPIDLPALQQATDEFIARLEGLTEDLVESSSSSPMAWWVVAIASAGGALEFVRRRLKQSAAAPVPEDGDPSSSWHSCLAITLIASDDVL